MMQVFMYFVLTDKKMKLLVIALVLTAIGGKLVTL